MINETTCEKALKCTNYLTGLSTKQFETYFNLALIIYDVSYMTSVIQYAADYKFIAIGV